MTIHNFIYSFQLCTIVSISVALGTNQGKSRTLLDFARGFYVLQWPRHRTRTMCWVFTFFSLANRTRLYLLFVATKVVATRVMLFFLLRLKLLQLELSTYLTIMEFCKSDRLLWKVGLQIVINGDEIMLTILLADVFISGMFYKIQFFQGLERKLHC